MKETTIKIDGKDLILKQSIRAIMAFEKLTGKEAFNANTTITDGVTMFYCMLQASNPEFSMTFDEFLSYIDTDPNAVPQYYNRLSTFINKTEKAVKEKPEAETR